MAQKIISSRTQDSLRREIYWEARKFFLSLGVFHMNSEETDAFLRSQWESEINSPDKKEIIIGKDMKAYYLDDQGRKVRSPTQYDMPKGWWPANFI